MKLKDRKKIQNIPKYNIGLDVRTPLNSSIGQKLDISAVEGNGRTLFYGKDAINPTLSTATNTNLNTPNYSGIAQSAIGFANSVYGSFSGTPGVSEVQSGVNASNGNIGGIEYVKYGNVNENDEIKKLNIGGNTLSAAGTGAALGASIGSIFPGAGTVIGGAIGAVAGAATGLIGGLTKKHKLRQRIAIAQGNINRINNFNRADAQSTALSNDYYSEYGDSSAGVLHANRGKDLKYIKYEK